MPVFAGGLRVKNFGNHTRRTALAQNSVRLARERIGRVAVGEGKIVGGKEMLVVLAIGPRR